MQSAMFWSGEPPDNNPASRAVIMAEAAVMHGCREILIGTSRQSLLHQYIKGNFQRRIEAILPDDVHVRVMTRGSIDEPYSAMATA